LYDVGGLLMGGQAEAVRSPSWETLWITFRYFAIDPLSSEPEPIETLIEGISDTIRTFRVRQHRQPPSRTTCLEAWWNTQELKDRPQAQIQNIA
jgi:hypothetical protein